jgi:hypothetical protein
MSACMGRLTTANNLIVSMQLSQGFLHQAHPNLLITSACKADLLSEARQIVIEYDWSLHAVDVQVHQVATSCVDLLSVKQSFDVLWIFCHRAQRCKEIAVTETAFLISFGSMPSANTSGVLKSSLIRFQVIWADFGWLPILSWLGGKSGSVYGWPLAMIASTCS